MDRPANVVPISALRKERQARRRVGREPPAAARRPYRLDEVRIPELVAALNAWRQIAPQGVFRYDTAGAMATLLQAGLLTEFSVMISATDPDPMNWLLLWWGSGYDAYSRTSAIGRTISELPNDDLVGESIKDYRDVIERRQPVVSCLTGSIIEGHSDGAPVYRVVGYDRIAFPLVDDLGEVRRLITVSKMFQGNWNEEEE